MILFSYDPI